VDAEQKSRDRIVENFGLGVHDLVNRAKHGDAESRPASVALRF
jgi:hypothetical protein